ncbi:MAG: hypothetical protein Fur0018_11100 [Anaerolineales bacterium]
MFEYTQVGNYEIEAPLPHSGVAMAFRGRRSGGEEVVIKVYPPFLRVDQGQAQRLSEVLALFGSPVFVPIYDVGVWQGHFYTVSRWMPGGSLEDMLRQQGRLQEKQAMQYLYRLTFGLNGLHALGYLHGNIKPANILFDEDGQPCLADLSLGRCVHLSPEASLSVRLEDPRYASPEQVWGWQRVNARSDVYSLGVLYFTMLTGAPPAGTVRDAQTVLSAARQQVVPIRQTAPQLSAPSARMLDRMLARDPTLRFSSLDGVLTHLEATLPGEKVMTIRARSESATLSSAQLSTLRPRTTKESADRGAPRWQAVALGLLVVVALVLGTLAALWQSGVPLSVLFGRQSSPSPAVTALAVQILSPTVTPPPLAPTVTATQAATAFAARPTAQTSATPEPVAQAVSTPALEPTVPVLGVADKIAFLAQNDIWIANVDGSDVQRLTTDENPKADLSWSADGTELFYVQKGVGYALNIHTGKTRRAFAPAAASRCTLRIGRLTRYSLDGRFAATVVQVSGHGRKEDVVQVYTFDENCTPDLIDSFPGDRFTMRGYSGAGDLAVIEDYAWDRRDTFILYGNVLHNGGDMVMYNLQTHKAREINPIEGRCCYRDVHFSPDGSYIGFVFQDVRYTNPAEVYFVPLAILDSGARLQPLPFPSYFFDASGVDVSLAIRPYVAPAEETATTQTGDNASAEVVEVGGADKLALLVNKDIWVVNLNGQGAERLTTSGIDKTYLQWSPDGEYVLYEEGKCLRAVSITSHQIINVGCYLSYGISADGRRILLSANVLFPDGLQRPLTSVVPYNLFLLSALSGYTDLTLTGGCGIDLLGDTYVWSPDGNRVAVLAEISAAGHKAQAVLVYELRACGQPPRLLDSFPANRFQVRGYSDVSPMPLLYDFAWNGDALFAINGAVHDGFGDFVLYDMNTGRASILDPLQRECCYREMRWSPDGTYVLFASEDPVEGLKLYYVPFSALDEKKPLAAIPMPAGFFHQGDTRKRLYPTLRPVQHAQPSLPYGQPPEKQEIGGFTLTDKVFVGYKSNANVIYSLAFSPDSGLMAMGSAKGLAVYNLTDRWVSQLATRAEYYDQPVTGVDFSADGTWLASTSVDGVTRIWRVSTGAPFQKVVLEGYPSLDTDYDPLNDLIATASADFTVHINQRNNAGTRHILRGHEGAVLAVRYATEGDRLVTGSVDRTVRVWSAQNGSLLQTLVGHLDAVSDVDFSPDGRLVASASWDGTVRLWDWQTGTQQFVLYGHQSPVLGARFSPDGRWVFSLDAAGWLCVWRVTDGALVYQEEINAAPYGALAVSPDGKYLAVGADSGGAWLYRINVP